MKKQLLFLLGIILMIPNSVTAQISLKKVFPKATTIWEKSCQGDLMDFVLTKNKKNIIVLSHGANNFNLYYLNSNGEKIWEKTQNFKYPEYQKTEFLSMSENAELIIIHGADKYEEGPLTWVFDNTGNLLFHKNEIKGFYFPSPKGNYILFQKRTGFDNIKLFDKYGKSIPLILPSELKEAKVKMKFISDEEALIYKKVKINNEVKSEFLLVTIPQFQIKWTQIIDKPLWCINFNLENVTHNNKYIVIQDTYPGKIYLLDKISGKILWRNNELKGGMIISFINRGKNLLSISGRRNIHIFSVLDGKSLFKSNILEKSILILPRISFENRKLIISTFIKTKDKNLCKRGEPIKGVNSYIINFDDNWNINQQNFVKGGTLSYSLNCETEIISILNDENNKKLIVKKISEGK